MIHSITAGIAGLETALGLVAELLSITALFTALNFLSNLIRFTYKAGKFTGYIWFTFIVPAILWLADGISYINSLIDWRFVADTVVDCLKVIVTLLVTAYITVKPYAINLIRASRKEISVAVFALVYWVSCTLAPASAVLSVPKRV